MKIIFLINLLFVSCATLKEESKENRTYVKIFETKNNKNDNFNNTNTFLAKSLNNSNFAIKLSDKDSGKIIAKIKYPCKGLKRPDVVVKINETLVDYTVDISFKDKKIKIETIMEGFTKELGLGYGNMSMFIAQDEGQDVVVRKCNQSLVEDIKQGISSNNNW